MIDKFKKASNERLLNWIEKAVDILVSRGYEINLKLPCKR